MENKVLKNHSLLQPDYAILQLKNFRGYVKYQAEWHYCHVKNYSVLYSQKTLTRTRQRRSSNESHHK